MTDKNNPEHIDLPQVEEDDTAGPTLKRYMLSREVRGWAAGVAALVVAVAAVTPAIDFANLTGSVANAFTEAADELSCTAEDQTGGLGGQHIKCGFSCPPEPGSITVAVDADDSGAQVSGTAACVGDSAHCSGKNTCSKTEPRTASGAGTCKADSDEAVDSGLYVECSAGVDSATGEVPGPGEELCPVHEPVMVCIQPVCYQVQSSLQEACMNVWTKLAPLINKGSIVVGFISFGDKGTGLACKGYVCTPLEL